MTAALVMLCLPFAATATDLYDFEGSGAGSLDGWTVTGFNFSSAYGDEHGTFGLVSGLNSTGTATSPNFTIDANTLQFMVGGQGKDAESATPWNIGGIFDTMTMAQMSQTWRLVRVSDSAVLSQGTGPFRDTSNSGGIQGTNGFLSVGGTLETPYMVDTGRYIGETVRLELIDTLGTTTTTGGTPTGGIWFGMDFVRTADRTIDSTSVLTVELPEQSGWTFTGNAFQFCAGVGPEFATSSNPPGDVNFTAPREGGEFVRSFGGRSGTARSPNFVLTRETLRAETMGFGALAPGGGGNSRVGTTHIYLKDASTNATLHEFGWLGGDSWASQSVDVTAWAGQSVYILLDDPDTDGWWAGIDDVRLTGDVTIPEPATVALLSLGSVALLRRRKARRA